MCLFLSVVNLSSTVYLARCWLTLCKHGMWLSDLRYSGLGVSEQRQSAQNWAKYTGLHHEAGFLA